MPRHGKKYRASREKVDRLKRYTVEEGLGLVKEMAKAKFDETVDMALNLGVNPKYSDQMVRGAVVLPHGTGKSVRVAVFATGDKPKEAEEAGADIDGAEDLVEKIEGGFLDFDQIERFVSEAGHVSRDELEARCVLRLRRERRKDLGGYPYSLGVLDLPGFL